MKKTIMLLTACLLPLLSSNGAMANGRGDDTALLEAVEVHARPGEAPFYSGYVVPESSKAATQVVDEEEIEDINPRDLYDVLNFTAGLNMTFQGRKGLNFAEMRGGGGLGIILDGLYIPWSQASRVMSNFPVDEIAYVKVVRDATVLSLGPLTNFTSAAASSNQGFVLIRTKTGRGSKGGLKAGYGSYHSLDGHVYHGRDIGNFHYRLSYNKKYTDGRDGWNNARNSDSVLLRLGYDGKRMVINGTFYYDWARREIQRATDENKTSDSKWEYDPLHTFMGAVDFNYLWSDTQSTSFEFYTGRIDTDLRMESFTKPSEAIYDQEDYVTEFGLRHVVQWGDNSLRVGGQAILWDTPTGEFYYETTPRKEQLYGVYVTDEHRFLNGRMTLDGGLRLDWKHVSKGIEKYGPGKGATPLLEDEWAEPVLTASLGASYELLPGWRVSGRLSYSEAQADGFIHTTDDQQLDDEKRLNAELGLKAEITRDLSGFLTLFYYDIDDYKMGVGTLKVQDDPEVYVGIYEAADVERRGFEAGLDGRLIDPLTYHLTYTYQESDNRDDERQIPRHMLGLRLQHRWRAVESNLSLRYVSGYENSRFATDNSSHGVGGYSRIDANINYDFSIRKLAARATLYGRNLSDQHYVTRLGWQDIGITVGGQLSVRF
jgi:iron complex outermembrane receptor protein